MGRSVVWSTEASDRISEIIEYLEFNWSQTEINTFLSQLAELEKRISKHPKLYPASVKKPDLRKAVISKVNSVIYKVTEESVQIVTVFDNRSNKNI
jgi:plasmid stabilization system protein ParE